MGGAKLGPLSSPLLILPGEQYVIVVPDIPAGRYAFDCALHANMRGALIVPGGATPPNGLLHLKELQ
jgi:hypothetical protein